MAYSVQSQKTGETYILHSKDVTLRGGRLQTIFLCSPRKRRRDGRTTSRLRSYGKLTNRSSNASQSKIDIC